MNEKEGKELQIDIGSILASLWKYKVLIILICAFFSLLTYTYYTYFATKIYRASSVVYILNSSDGRSTTSATTYSNLQASKSLSADIERMMTNVSVAERVVNKLGLNMSAGVLASKVSVSTTEETRIVVINVEDDDPYRAAQIANAVRETSTVRITKAMGLDAMNLISEARVPMSPSNNRTRRNTTLVLVFALVVSIGIVTIIDILNDTIKSADDIERYLGISTLGSIPSVKQLQDDGESEE